jgi:hypothetical protein
MGYSGGGWKGEAVRYGGVYVPSRPPPWPFLPVGNDCECIEECVLLLCWGSLENRRRRPVTAWDQEPEVERELESAGVEVPDDDAEERS